MGTHHLAISFCEGLIFLHVHVESHLRRDFGPFHKNLYRLLHDIDNVILVELSIRAQPLCVHSCALMLNKINIVQNHSIECSKNEFVYSVSPYYYIKSQGNLPSTAVEKLTVGMNIIIIMSE